MSRTRFYLVWMLSLAIIGTVFTALSHAEDSNPRFGKWKLKSDAPAPASNIMTYEPHGDGGMKITIVAVNREGKTRTWGYVTMFDGKYRPVTGDSNTEDSAVEVVDERTNKIYNRTGERTNTIINVLSEDGNTINNEYHNTNEDGTERVSHAVYERIQ